MRGQKIYNKSLIRLITTYALFTGIITFVFFFFLWNQTKIVKQNLNPTPTTTIYASPSSSPSGKPTEQGKFCGGIAGKKCTSGYTCKLDGTYPDAGGTCIKK